MQSKEIPLGTCVIRFFYLTLYPVIILPSRGYYWVFPLKEQQKKTRNNSFNKRLLPSFKWT